MFGKLSGLLAAPVAGWGLAARRSFLASILLT